MLHKVTLHKKEAIVPNKYAVFLHELLYTVQWQYSVFTCVAVNCFL